MADRRLRLLILAREFPSPAKPHTGLWVESQARALVRHAGMDVRVIAPVPRVPPVPVSGLWAALKRVPAERDSDGLQIYHPRQWVGLGQALIDWEGATYVRAVRGLARRLRVEWPFDAIHAHFVYPDGYAGARLAEQLGIPLVVGEHAFWQPWLGARPRIRAKALFAAHRAARVIANSEALRRSIVAVTGGHEKVEVIPNGVDVDVFSTDGASPPRALELLYVGWPTYHKGLDILIRALPAIVRARPDARLMVVGGSIYRTQRHQEREIRALAAELGVTSRIAWTGPLTPPEIAARMRASTLLVSPSRRETFGAVIVEAMACGRPVVATRSGGPEEIVTPEVGVLVPRDDPQALAAGILEVAAHSERYDPRVIRARAVERYGWETVARRLARVIEEVVGGNRAGQRMRRADALSADTAGET